MDESFEKEKNNLKGIITVARHGPKDENGQLDINKIYEISASSNRIKNLNGILQHFSSPVKRTLDTGIIMSFRLAHITGKNHRNKLMQGIQVQELHYIDTSKSPTSNWFEENWTGDDSDENWNNRRALNFLSDPQLQLNAYTDGTLSPRIMAMRMALVLLDQLNYIKYLDEVERINLIDVTHEPVLLSFLYFLFKDEYRVSGSQDKSFIEWLGGTIKPAEFFSIEVKLDGSMKIKFRKFERVITVEDLEKMVIEDLEG